jgi:hypothetical protein
VRCDVMRAAAIEMVNLGEASNDGLFEQVEVVQDEVSSGGNGECKMKVTSLT